MAAPAARRLPGPGLRLCAPCLAPSLRIGPRSTSIVRASRLAMELHSGVVPAGKPLQSVSPSQNFVQHYFSANTSIDRGWIKSGMLAAARTIAESSREGGQNQADIYTRRTRTHGELERALSFQEEIPKEAEPQQHQILVDGTAPAVEHAQVDDVLPHRKRKRRKATTSSPEESLPLDASSQLTTAATAMPKSAFIRRRMATYLSLSKPRLSLLVVLTTTSAYSLYPIPDILSATASTSTTFSTSTLTLLFLTSGTFLSSACANTLNMLFEHRYDALMSRTRNRPIVRKLISPRAAAAFALLCGASGLLLLGLGTNPTVAGLSALNILLYAGCYTPLKRISAVNTWVGAVVGGIPPLMGWCAAAGDVATKEAHSWQDLLLSESSVGGWLMACLLFAWQLPHFTGLSYMIRDDYRRAKYVMLAVTNPARNARVAVRYSFAMFPICGALYWGGYVDSGFLVISTACNVWLTRAALLFWRDHGAAKGLFWASVWHLPLVLVGALVCKRGLWDGFFGTNDSTSIYEEQQLDADGETLGMDLRKPGRQPQPPDLNMAMIGFKRPT